MKYKPVSIEGQKLKELRVFLELGKAAMARALGLKYQTYFNWEVRGTRPDVAALRGGLLRVLKRLNGVKLDEDLARLLAYVMESGPPLWQGDKPSWRAGQCPVQRTGRKNVKFNDAVQDAGGAVVPAVSTPTPPAQPIVFAELDQDLLEIEEIAWQGETLADPAVMQATFRRIRKLALASRAELATSGSALTTPSGLEPENGWSNPAWNRADNVVRLALPGLIGREAA